MGTAARCMTPECGGYRYCRGVCERCYDRMFERVRAGAATWDGLEAAGRLLPAKKQGRPRRGETARDKALRAGPEYVI